MGVTCSLPTHPTMPHMARSSFSRAPALGRTALECGSTNRRSRPIPRTSWTSERCAVAGAHSGVAPPSRKETREVGRGGQARVRLGPTHRGCALRHIVLVVFLLTV